MRVYVRRSAACGVVSDCCTVLPISGAKPICTAPYLLSLGDHRNKTEEDVMMS